MICGAAHVSATFPLDGVAVSAVGPLAGRAHTVCTYAGTP